MFIDRGTDEVQKRPKGTTIKALGQFPAILTEQDLSLIVLLQGTTAQDLIHLSRSRGSSTLAVGFNETDRHRNEHTPQGGSSMNSG